ncbi:hypothetical protein [Actinokineospora sp. NBRC 105648]|uniref:hypothetical protein n=1 Tax=Actinokineospora sp. NBRC 105648 TaxID=3032206 RepID=UPI0024A16DBB|nr:hypothetical protein [Actinokineospora sp. NBRC 105648]GLZ41129.1 hypothetical protein Acsp05_47530 [Actinokineospora sp. NBRC 105648]
MSATPELRQQTGTYFTFLLPAGWTVQENSNLLCLNSPDQQAAIMTVGLVGMLQPFSPDQFVAYAMQMQGIPVTAFHSGRPIPPPPGASAAGFFELSYAAGQVICHGVAVANVTHGYGQCNASMTLAAAQAPSWPAYREWLPGVASHVAPAGSQTYMAGTVARQNLDNSIALGERFHAVNDYGQRRWQEVTDDRWRSDERNQFAFREALGNVDTRVNPYDNNRPIELSTQYRFYWVNRQGEIRGSDDPNYDPRVGSTDDWATMPRYQP